MSSEKLIIPDSVQPIELERQDFDLFFQERTGCCDKCGRDFGGQPTPFMFGAKRKKRGRFLVADEEATVLICKDCWTGVFGELPELLKGRVLENAVEIEGYKYDSNDFLSLFDEPHFVFGDRMVIGGQDFTHLENCGVCRSVLFEVEYVYANRNKNESNPLGPKLCRDCWNLAFGPHHEANKEKKRQDRDATQREKEIEQKRINPPAESEEHFLDRLKDLGGMLCFAFFGGIILAGLTRGCEGAPLTPEEEIDIKREQHWR